MEMYSMYCAFILGNAAPIFVYLIEKFCHLFL